MSGWLSKIYVIDKITNIKHKEGDDYLITADLTIKNKTHPIDFFANVKIDKNAALASGKLNTEIMFLIGISLDNFIFSSNFFRICLSLSENFCIFFVWATMILGISVDTVLNLSSTNWAAFVDSALSGRKSVWLVLWFNCGANGIIKLAKIIQDIKVIHFPFLELEKFVMKFII